MTATAKAPPAGLGDAGRAYWREVTKVYELGIDELVLLRTTCALLDELAAFDEAIAADGLVVAGSNDQPRPHPLVAQRRASRRLLAGLIAQLGLPDAEGGAVATPLQQRGRKAAQARWSRDPRQQERRRGAAS